MSNPPKLPSPAEQLRDRLAMAKRAHLPFDVAWERAWRRVKWPHDTEHRRQYKCALGATRGVWESSYNGEWSPAAESVQMLEMVG